MFSPSSGSLNSLGPEMVARDEAGAEAGGAGGCAGGDDTAGASCEAGAGAAAAALAADSAGALTSAPSTVNMTWPTLILSPSFTRISCTVPLTDEGTSTTALSVSSSMTDWPALTVAPGATMRRTRSPCSMFSPSSGSLNSITASVLFSDLVISLCVASRG